MRRIAVVDDNAVNRRLVKAMVKRLYELDEYEDGPTALAGIAQSPPELVLLDISLPGMDGVEVLRRIREEPRFAEIPVIAMTAHALVGDRERFLKEGFDDYIGKPMVDIPAVMEQIARHLG